jgi:thioredoxin-like negative regulator of GroEL
MNDPKSPRVKPRPRVPRGPRPAYLDARHNDALLSMVMVLATELSVCQDRIQGLTELLVQKTGAAPAEVEAATRRAVGSSEAAGRRSRTLKRLLRILLEDATPESREAREQAYRQFVESLGG